MWKLCGMCVFFLAEKAREVAVFLPGSTFTFPLILPFAPGFVLSSGISSLSFPSWAQTKRVEPATFSCSVGKPAQSQRQGVWWPWKSMAESLTVRSWPPFKNRFLLSTQCTPFISCVTLGN